MGIFFSYILAYTLIIIFLVFAVDYINYKNSLKYFNTIDNIINHNEYLINDLYNKIPKNDYYGCNFIVYDENYNPIFTTDDDFFNDLNADNIEFIVDNISNTSYKVYYLDNDERAYLVALVKDNEINNELQSYLILNKNLEIVGGDLFSDKKSLSPDQFKILEKNLIIGYDLKKCQYLNYNNEKRILVFANIDLTESQYLNSIDNYNINFYIIYILIVVLMILISLLLKRNLLNKIQPINKAILSYKKSGEYKINDEAILGDYKIIMDSFQDLTKELKKNQEDKERIIADISHDLKTPLTSIIGYSNALANNIVDINKQQTYLQLINEKAILANNLLNSLVEYSKINHPEYRLNLETINICELIRNYVISIYERISQKGFLVEVDIPEEKHLVELDKSLFLRVIDNIVDNSLKYNSSGTTLFFKLEAENNAILLYIGDNGVGIDAEIKERIFEPFITSNTARSANLGSGLGLSIVKKILTLHDFDIKLVDDKKYKTMFLIKITRD